MIWKLLLLLYVFDVAVHQTTSANLFETLVSSTTESHITNFLHQPRADSRADKPKESEEDDSVEENEVNGPTPESTSSSSANHDNTGNHHHNHNRQSGEDQAESSPFGKAFTDFRDRIEDAINVISDRQHLPIHFNIPSHHHHHHHSHHNSTNHTGHDPNEHHQNHDEHHQNHDEHHQSILPFAESFQTKTRIFSSLVLSPLLNLLAGASRQIDGPSILSTLIGGPAAALNGQHNNKKRETESEDSENNDQRWQDHDPDHHHSEHGHDHQETPGTESLLSQHLRGKARTIASIILGPVMGFLADSSRNVDVGPLLSASSGGPNGGGGLVDSHENRKRESNDIPLEMKESERERSEDRERPISKLLSTISNAVAQRLSNKDPLRLDLLKNNGDTGGIDEDQLDFDDESDDENIPDFPFDDEVETASGSSQSRTVPTETAGVFILEIIGTIAGLTWGIINQIQNILRPKTN